jgi:hypothetical protein
VAGMTAVQASAKPPFQVQLPPVGAIVPLLSVRVVRSLGRIRMSFDLHRIGDESHF